MAKIEMIIRLTLAKVEIFKLKSSNGGYDYSHVSKKDQEQIEKCLVDIDELLNKITC